MVNPSPPRFPVQISGDLPPGAKKGEPGHPAKAHVNQSPKSVGYYPIDLSQTPIESSHSHSSTYTLASSYNGTVHLARRLPPRGVKEARPQLFRLQIPGGTQGENVLTDAIACEEILPFSPGGAERFRGRSDRGKHGLGSTSIHGDSLQIQTDSITEGSDRPDLVHESGDLSPETPTLVTPRPLYDQHQQLGPHSFSICVAEHGISGNLGGMGEGAGFGQDRALEELIRRTGNVAKRARRGAV
ncbi:hypothetical protein IAR55_003411 [Kwoniella newhampshirensis]|uniref:Uncharacterized protein n=1 Tax=Kwoniella newhampshirensis TaxID=1651941 RepID=A0AAW0YME1_9TREE